MTSTVFQFHKGTIRTVQMVLLVLNLTDFNSIKVQLELNQAMGALLPKFQFHKGTIRTCMPWYR